MASTHSCSGNSHDDQSQRRPESGFEDDVVTNHRRRSPTLELWHLVVTTLLNVVSFLARSFIVRTICKIRLYIERLIRVLLTQMTRFFVPAAAPRLSAGCEDMRVVPTAATPSCHDPTPLLWNFQALLKQILNNIRMVIVALMNIQAMVKVMTQLFLIFKVSQTFAKTLMWNTISSSQSQVSKIQQDSMLFSLNQELRDAIFAKLSINDVACLQVVCKDFQGVMINDTFKARRKMTEGLFGPNVFYLENNISHMTWQWMAYDIIHQQWRKMPSFSYLPLPNIELFKDFFVAGGNGLFCIDVGKENIEELIIYQPLTKQRKTLPPLNHRRRPVLIHVLVEAISNTYKIIVAGSSTIGTNNLSQKTEIYDSWTQAWKESDDIPGPEFALNDYQTGVYMKSLETLFCIGFLPNDKGRGILAYNVTKGVWIKNVLCQLPQSFLYNNPQVPPQITIAQLLEYKNEIFLFSEQESGQEVTHSIHKLQQHFEQLEVLQDDETNIGGDGMTWMRILCESRNGVRGLLVYPEFECSAHGKDKFCIFNTIERTGALYNIHYQNDVFTYNKSDIPLFPRLKENCLTFHSLNPLAFTTAPTFKISI